MGVIHEEPVKATYIYLFIVCSISLNKVVIFTSDFIPPFISTFSIIQIIDEFVDVSANMHVFSPVFKVPPLEFYIVKHFTKLQNKFQMNLTVSQHGYKDVSAIQAFLQVFKCTFNSSTVSIPASFTNPLRISSRTSSSKHRSREAKTPKLVLVF